MQERERTCTNRGRPRIQRGDKICPEQRGIVVALVDNQEATLKRLRRRGDSIALEAANPAFDVTPARLITAIGGGMLVLVGVLEVTGAWLTMLTWMKIHWISNYQSPL